MTAFQCNVTKALSRTGAGLLAAAAGTVLLLVATVGCSYDNGTTRSKSTRTVETPSETTTTTTTRERTVEDAPR